MTRLPDCLAAPQLVEVHLWWLGLPVSFGPEQEGWLTPEERDRAGRYLRETDAHCFRSGRTALRGLAAAYTGVPPEALDFTSGEWGKPFLAGSSLRFNLTHSGDHLLLAFATGREVGVDLELVRPDRELLSIAERFFAPSEAEALLGLAAEERTDAFYRVWTRKEAVIKAVGMGLSLPLDSFSVSVRPDAALLQSPAVMPHLSLQDLTAPEGYFAALCVQGDEPRVFSRSLNASL